MSRILFLRSLCQEYRGAKKLAARNGGLRSSFSTVERQIDDDLITAQLREEEQMHVVSSQNRENFIVDANDKNSRHTQKHHEFHSNKLSPVEQHTKQGAMDAKTEATFRRASTRSLWKPLSIKIATLYHPHVA